MKTELSRSQPPSPSEGAAPRRVAGAAPLVPPGNPGAKLLARRAVSFLARAALRARSHPLDIRGLAQALVVAPHPDDDALGCGGTIALMSDCGHPPHVAFVTDGEGSHPSHATLSRADLGALRRAEARAALSELRVPGDQISFMGAPDGFLSRLDAAQSAGLVAGLAGLMVRLKPDAVLLPCRGDGSSEHESAFSLVIRAVSQAGIGPRILEFPVWALWRPTRLLGLALNCPRVWRADISSVRDRKARAVSLHETQIRPLPPDTAPALPPGFASMFLGGDEHFFEH